MVSNNALLRHVRPHAAAMVDSVLVFALAAALVWPLFTTEYFDNWGSIESTFIADGRFLKENWPHPRWQPLWYGGTRFDYIYPPALRYGTAALALTFGLSEARAYHIYVAFFYALGIVGVYVLVRVGMRSRGAAWLGAAAAALLSPSFVFLSVLRHDSEFLGPQRLHVLVKYGEGPHITAVSLLPFALAAALLALRGRSRAALAGAACLSAAVVLNNFYGATSLALFYAVLVWSVWVTHLDRRVWMRALAIPALAFGLTAFWLVPSYFRITIANLGIVSPKGNAWSAWLAVAVMIILGLLSWTFARSRRELAYPVFVSGSCVVFALNVLGHYGFRFRVVGEPARLVPELDLAIILAGVAGWLWLWRTKSPIGTGLRRHVPRAAAVLIVLLAFFPARRFVAHAWRIYPPNPNYENRVEYRISTWMARNMPESRAFVTGSVRFWYDVWHNLAQIGGGSEQGVLNQNVEPAQWEVVLGPKPEPGILWLTCLGADAVVVPDKSSKEIYHDYAYPKKFAGVLPVLYDDGEGNAIYGVPRRFPALARVVDARQAAAVKPIRFNDDVEHLGLYADLLEKGPGHPVEMRREGPDAILLRATVDKGQSLLVQVAYDPYWRAYADKERLPVRRDVLGHMIIEAPAGTHDIRLVFELPLENLGGRVVTCLCLGGIVFIAANSFRKRRAAA